MVYIVESSKSFAEVVFDLEPVVQRLGFVVLHTHNLGELLQQKAIDCDDDCQVFDLFNYRYAQKILAADVRLSLTLPWRISVFTENGATKIAVMRPPAQLHQPALARLAAEIEERLRLIVDETR